MDTFDLISGLKEIKTRMEKKKEEGLLRISEPGSFPAAGTRSEIRNDALKRLEHGTDVSRSAMLSTLERFNTVALPKFSGGGDVRRARASVLFQGLYAAPTAMAVMNDRYNYQIGWSGGFLVGWNVPVIYFRFWKYKNKDGFYTKKVDDYFESIAGRYPNSFSVLGRRYQDLDGYACIPMMPTVEGVRIGNRGKWYLIGTRRGDA